MGSNISQIFRDYVITKRNDRYILHNYSYIYNRWQTIGEKHTYMIYDEEKLLKGIVECTSYFIDQMNNYTIYKFDQKTLLDSPTIIQYTETYPTHHEHYDPDNKEIKNKKVGIYDKEKNKIIMTEYDIKYGVVVNASETEPIIYQKIKEYRGFNIYL